MWSVCLEAEASCLYQTPDLNSLTHKLKWTQRCRPGCSLMFVLPLLASVSPLMMFYAILSWKSGHDEVHIPHFLLFYLTWWWVFFFSFSECWSKLTAYCFFLSFCTIHIHSIFLPAHFRIYNMQQSRAGVQALVVCEYEGRSIILNWLNQWNHGHR